MSAEAIRLRTSCIADRADGLAVTLKASGHSYEAALARLMANNLRAGAPTAFYERRIAELEALLLPIEAPEPGARDYDKIRPFWDIVFIPACLLIGCALGLLMA